MVAIPYTLVCKNFLLGFVTLMLAIVPYLLLRGLVNRIASGSRK